jgi:hypothetical protein
MLGYSLGLHSKWIIKSSVSVYMDQQMKMLYANMSHHIEETQKKCNILLDQAQKESIKMYRKALIESEGIIEIEDNGLN